MGGNRRPRPLGGVSPAFDLYREASGFAERLTRLLNTTVCDGIRMKAVLSKPDRVVVGYRIDRRLLDLRHGIPLALAGRKPRAYLGVYFRLHANAENAYLAVESSVAGLYADARLERELLRYDYERNKETYPEAHLQVDATPPAWEVIGPPGKTFAKVHLPLGGRRNRPILEDLVEMSIVEGIAEGRPGWQAAVAEGRERFRVGQLRAAVRRDPDTAAAVLAELGRS